MPAGGAPETLAALGRDEIRARAAEILDRPEYARWRALDAEWVERLQRMIADAFERVGELLAWLDGLHGSRPLLYWTVLLALASLAALLLGHVVLAVRAALASPPPAEPPPAAPWARSLADEAAQLADAGLFLEAAHRMQLATIELLLRRGVLRLARHDPNRTLRRRLADAPLGAGERDEIARLVDRVETTVFRDRRADPELYARWRHVHARLASAGEAA